MTKEDLEEIEGYLTEDIQHDLPFMRKMWGDEDELVKEYIRLLKERNAEIPPAEKPRLIRTRWGYSIV